jgi:hypothetical protein
MARAPGSRFGWNERNPRRAAASRRELRLADADPRGDLLGLHALVREHCIERDASGHQKILLWVGTLGMLSTRWGSLSPYAATMVQYIGSANPRKLPPPVVDAHALALCYFALFTAAGYLLFAGARNKG